MQARTGLATLFVSWLLAAALIAPSVAAPILTRDPALASSTATLGIAPVREPMESGPGPRPLRAAGAPLDRPPFDDPASRSFGEVDNAARPVQANVRDVAPLTSAITALDVNFPAL